MVLLELLAWPLPCTSPLLPCLLPSTVVKCHSNDKPWVTNQFRSLILRLQAAWFSNDMPNCRRPHNEINRMFPKLKKHYFATKLHCLLTTNSHNWRRETKIIARQTTQAYCGIESLANHVTEGVVHALADKSNIFFYSVSKDLPPLSEIAILPQSLDFPSNLYIDTAAVERKLSQININKAPRPDGLLNWFLRDFAPFCGSLNAQFLILPFASVCFTYLEECKCNSDPQS